MHNLEVVILSKDFLICKYLKQRTNMISDVEINALVIFYDVFLTKILKLLISTPA